MCTLILVFRQDPRFPLIIAANRDEVLDRPASGPRVWAEGFIAPRDERAGGTWLGLNRHGLFVGVTNRFLAPRQDQRESRGQLVVEALKEPSAASLHAAMATLPPTRFNAFHLLYADAAGAFVTWSDGERLCQDTLAPGVHVVTERSLGGDDRSRSDFIRQHLPATVTADALQRLLGLTREDDPLGGVCVEAPAFNYGTRSSAVLFVAQPLLHSQLTFADGRPDRAPFTDRSHLVGELLHR